MENLSEWMLAVSILTVIASTICSFGAIMSTRKLAKQQSQFQFFAEYTRRYQDLILNMPPNLDESSIHNKNVDAYMRLYFDLCSEEFYLHSKGVIDSFVWDLWADGIKDVMKKQKYRTAWKLLGGYYTDPSFISFMNDLTRD